MAFDHKAYMAKRGTKPGSRVKLKDGTKFQVPGYAAVYTTDVLADLARLGGVAKYVNPKVGVGEVEVTPVNAMAAGDEAEAFVRACVTGKDPAPATDPTPAPNGQHNRVKDAAAK